MIDQAIVAGICEGGLACPEGSVQKWDLQSGLTIGSAHKEFATSDQGATICFLPSNVNLDKVGFVALNGQKKSLNYYVFGKERPIYRFFGQEKLTALAVRSYGNCLVVGNEEGKLWAWDMANGEVIFMISEAHYQRVTTLNFSSDEEYLISGSADGTIKVWSWNELVYGQNMPRFCFSDHTKEICDVHVGFGVDRSFRIVTASGDGSVMMYDAIDGVAMARFEFPSPITSVLMTSSEGIIIAGAEDGNVYLIDLMSDSQDIIRETQVQYGEKTFYVLKTGHSASISRLVLSLDEAMLVAGDMDGQIFVWNLSCQQIARKIKAGGPVRWLGIVTRASCEIDNDKNLIMAQPKRTLTRLLNLQSIHKVAPLSSDNETSSSHDDTCGREELLVQYSRLVDYVFSKFQ